MARVRDSVSDAALDTLPPDLVRLPDDGTPNGHANGDDKCIVRLSILRLDSHVNALRVHSHAMSPAQSRTYNC